MRHFFKGALIAAGLLCCAGAAPAQSAQTGAPSGQGRSSNRLPDASGTLADPGDPMAATREASRARAAADERQKKIVDDSTKLLELANQLKKDVEKTTKNEMSLDVIRKAEEIERLARDLKQRMKG